MSAYSTAQSGGNSHVHGKTFESFLEPAPKRRNFFLRLFCGSGNTHHKDRHVVSAHDVRQTRSAQVSQPSAGARRKARHTGDTQGLYRTRTGYNADTGSVYYSPRYGVTDVIKRGFPMLRGHYNVSRLITAFNTKACCIFDSVQLAQLRRSSMSR
ncbi:uncharacterized protein PG998_007104 [Apiospora kogelbergensis]|uniref:uncharacterized protein n=1 Tax=Apiospora kogelbergensis TaxID=1337665 RepID=UPI0031301FA7